MKVRQALLLLVVAASVAWAQAGSTAGGDAAGATSAPASQSSASKWSAKAKPSPTAAKPMKPSAPKAKGAAAEAPKAPPGKRDPFLSPVVARGLGPEAGCTTGKRCLVIDQMILRGVIKTHNGMIAVVANTANKAYFLKENDPVFNGYVVKITGDSVVFKENTVDNLGRPQTREIVKKVSAPAV